MTHGLSRNTVTMRNAINGKPEDKMNGSERFSLPIFLYI